mmetsp:Transcript_23453/g.40026  ORF Transcript_23453/g.40026 Transcript_23453/m.40026 type:complete len:124 (-) Transcript_23453:270-641(-)
MGKQLSSNTYNLHRSGVSATFSVIIPKFLETEKFLHRKRQYTPPTTPYHFGTGRTLSTTNFATIYSSLFLYVSRPSWKTYPYESHKMFLSLYFSVVRETPTQKIPQHSPGFSSNSAPPPPIVV